MTEVALASLEEIDNDRDGDEDGTVRRREIISNINSYEIIFNGELLTPSFHKTIFFINEDEEPEEFVITYGYIETEFFLFVVEHLLSIY